MSDTTPDDERRPDAPLEPARPDSAGEERAFTEGFPWRWLAVGAAVVAAVAATYVSRRTAEADALRAQIVRTHEGELSELGTRYARFLERIEGFVTAEARRTEPERFVDPRLRVASLGSGQGLYLRVPAAEATDPDKLAAAAMRMEGDAITRCLGVAPASARSLYALRGFLGPELIERANTTTDVMGLRVIDDELQRRIARDLPPVANLLRSDWFLLALERGENRRDHPVDVYLWDLRSDRQLLAVRTRADGLLLPVRIAMPGAGTAPRPTAATGGASDCSIAAQVKELTGEPATRFGAALEPSSAPASSDAGLADGAPTVVDAGIRPASP
jgi:hypothetical protein